LTRPAYILAQQFGGPTSYNVFGWFCFLELHHVDPVLLEDNLLG